MLKKYLFAIISFCLLFGLASCSESDNYEGTLKFETSENGETVTISYVIDGEEVSYTVPNNVNYLSGGFAATDDLYRELPDSLMTGVYGENGEHYVGLFYFLWQGEHGDSGIFDLQKILETGGDDSLNAESGLYGPVGAMHWFSEPLYGYYYAKDEWVIRKHMELLSNANIDFVFFDATNAFPYIDNAIQVMKVCHEMNEQGYDAPQIVFYTNSSSKNTIETIYKEIYAENVYPDTWFIVDGRSCIIGTESESVGSGKFSDEIKSFFTIKYSQWPNEPVREDIEYTAWPWMDWTWPQRVFANPITGVSEAINVSIAQHSGSGWFTDSSLYGDYTNRGRSFSYQKVDNFNLKESFENFNSDNSLTNHGFNFQTQWERAFEVDVPYVLVTGWNEWVAQRQDGANLVGDSSRVIFVDTASDEYSRDIEIMRGGYFDNYYMQLISNVQKLKGSAPVLIQDARNKIDISGDFSQWEKVLVTYTDPEGDCADRNAPCFGNSTYTDYSGRNDIVEAKLTNDTKNLYFYVRTVDDIVLCDGNSSWMQLFVNTDNSIYTGWYGYDYIINNSALNSSITTVASHPVKTVEFISDNRYEFNVDGEVEYKVEGNEMMISVPLEMLGIDDYSKIYIEFKWADADEGVFFNEMEDFYEFGDAAPLGRLNWIYQNYIPE